MNIYVGNLSPDVSEEDLRKAFEAHGEVSSANVIKDKYSGRSITRFWFRRNAR